jgi:hypothetical protein
VTSRDAEKVEGRNPKAEGRAERPES